MQAAAIDASVASSEKGLAGTRRYVAYYRMSIGRLEQFALGFDAQRAAVERYIAANPGRLIAELSETVSGRKNARPKLQEALYLCRLFRAVLVIARLDRLSRNVELITRLMESGTEFVAVDFPHANRFTIHVLAAIAEYESQLLSERMKAAYAAARERGAVVWPPASPCFWCSSFAGGRGRRRNWQWQGRKPMPRTTPNRNFWPI